MKLPFTIINKYNTFKTKEEIYNIINSQQSEKLFAGMRYDKFYSEIKNDEFKIYREAFGIDAFLEKYPLITSRFLNENPTKLEITIKPNYSDIFFFSIFIIAFICASIFMKEVEINGALKSPPGIYDRLIFGSVSIVLALWCYLGFIRPIYKTEKWVKDKFELKEIT